MVELRHAGAFLFEAHIRANVTRHTEQRPRSEPGWGPFGFQAWAEP